MINRQLSWNDSQTSAGRQKRPLPCGGHFFVTMGMILFGICIFPLHAEEIRHHEAHAHGVAQLNVAMEDKRLYIEFYSPAANIVGFEHHPRTTAQKDAVAAATAQLKAAETLFLLPPKSQCQLVSADVATDIAGHVEQDADPKKGSAQDAHHHDEHHQDAHAEEDHHDEHAEEHDEANQAHETDHGSDAHEDERHSEYQANYQFSCDNPEALTEMAVMLFQRFPAIERIEVQQLVGNRQSATELTATKNRLEF